MNVWIKYIMLYTDPNKCGTLIELIDWIKVATLPSLLCLPCLTENSATSFLKTYSVLVFNFSIYPTC